MTPEMTTGLFGLIIALITGSVSIYGIRMAAKTNSAMAANNIRVNGIDERLRACEEKWKALLDERNEALKQLDDCEERQFRLLKRRHDKAEEKE